MFTTIGLDIYFFKVKPSKQVDTTDPYALTDFHYDTFKAKATKYLDKKWAQIQATTSIVERTKLINNIVEFCRRNRMYSYQYNDITPQLTNDELKKKLDSIKTWPAREADVYFRKVNFVYAFFAPYLVAEGCIVTKDMVKELLDKCKQVIAAGQAAGVLNEKEEINPLLYYQYKDGENWINITKERRDEEEARIAKLTEELSNDWIDIAKELLPTQSGFFFGSTDYTPYYLADVVNCKNQFERLMKNWKGNEIVANHMSW